MASWTTLLKYTEHKTSNEFYKTPKMKEREIDSLEKMKMKMK